MRKLIMLFLFMVGYLSAQLLWAITTPEGYWRTYDLSQRPRSIIKLMQSNGTLRGVIAHLLASQANQTHCSACTGKWHNAPLIGLPIIWGLKKEGDKWVNGYVLNVDNGKIYRCNLSVSINGQILYFSPYLGTPLLGKTLNWERVANRS